MQNFDVRKLKKKKSKTEKRRRNEKNIDWKHFFFKERGKKCLPLKIINPLIFPPIAVSCCNLLYRPGLKEIGGLLIIIFFFFRYLWRAKK